MLRSKSETQRAKPSEFACHSIPVRRPMHEASASKFLGLILRHQLETIGLQLDANGLANNDELIALAGACGTGIDRDRIDESSQQATRNDFCRVPTDLVFALHKGHSASIDLELPADTPRSPFP